MVLCVLLPVAASPASAKKRHAPSPERVGSRQLRGAMVTPNWSVEGSPFTTTPEQQRAEIAQVAAMGGNLIRFHVDWSRLMPDAFMQVDRDYLRRVDQVIAWAAADRIQVI